jgi:hypothetical protein
MSSHLPSSYELEMLLRHVNASRISGFLLPPRSVPLRLMGRDEWGPQIGLAERRLGRLLHGKKRDEYLLSSKVGKLFKASRPHLLD